MGVPIAPEDAEALRGPDAGSALATLAILLAGLALAIAATARLPVYGDLLLLALHPKEVGIASAVVEQVRQSPPRLAYRFHPEAQAPAFRKRVPVPPPVAQGLKPGAKLDVVFWRSHPAASVPRGQYRLGGRFWTVLGALWLVLSGALGVAWLLWWWLWDFFRPRQHRLPD